MTNQPKVCVVILNWNGRHYLEKFLPSLVASRWENLELIVADNSSTDDSLSFLSTHFPKVRQIRNSGNLGFAGGYNEALNQVSGDYFVLLNSDVEVTADWIAPVIQVMERDPSIAAAQPKLRAYHQREYFEYAGAAGGFLDRYGYPFCRGRIFDTLEQDTGQYDAASEIFWASGAAFFIRERAWKQSGGFDADFFAHMEEIDLCWRLKNLGHRVVYCPSSVVYHVGGGTLSAENPYKTYLNFRNNLFMLVKNLPRNRRFPVLLARFFLDLASLLKFAADGKFRQVRAINKAHVAFFRGLRKNLRKTRKPTSVPNTAGNYPGSIVWQYFAKKKRKFAELDFD
jgi:GT2 family glycosyltransferase